MLAWQRHYQAVWEQERLFEANAPAEGAACHPLQDLTMLAA
jgi:hypothetical protein